MTIAVYLAGRSEDLPAIRTLRDRLATHDISCTSRWLDGLDTSERIGALKCLADIARCDVVVLVNPPKVHRSGTGGRHVETGLALAIGRPVIVFGARENVFHYLPHVRYVPKGSPGTDLVDAIREAAPERGQLEADGTRRVVQP